MPGPAAQKVESQKQKPVMLSSANVERLMVVIVVYERDLSRVTSLSTVRRAMQAHQLVNLKVDVVLIYDNSLHPSATTALSAADCTYIHDSSNGGTAAAYARAASMAIDAGIDWLLLLDQDTLVPENFFVQVSGALARGAPTRPGALVPWVSDDERIVSPARITAFGSIRPVSRARKVTHRDWITAVASGCLINVPVFVQLLPFPTGFWLDYVDHWMFARLRELGQPITIIDASLQHSLSILTPVSLSQRRFRSILEGERHFHRLLRPLARGCYPLRLFGRMVRYAFVHPRLAMNLATWFAHRA